MDAQRRATHVIASEEQYKVFCQVKIKPLSRIFQLECLKITLAKCIQNVGVKAILALFV